ncbi:hypothetical protein AJ80_07323 [Polytolypa hystricis UAMH7299]|uniref:Uncharacterized protein n=1 Tax=Polytolypa hystricis (strain UAMH7299) TaxID=1447883 RepID=A0A2B7XP74_POLH7|nr:hypothetical protein AJ80_07323 [Polytolypa hystricis UAMH7299]
MIARHRGSDLTQLFWRYLCEANVLQDPEDLCEVNLAAVDALEDEEQNIDLLAILSHQAIMYESREMRERQSN